MLEYIYLDYIMIKIYFFYKIIDFDLVFSKNVVELKSSYSTHNN